MFCKMIGGLSLLFSAFSSFACDTCGKNESLNLDKIVDMQQQMHQKIETELSIPRLLVFVSFSMPEKSLKTLAKQVNQAGGTLLLQGLHENSISKTMSKVKTVLDEYLTVDLKLDPESFQKFNIHTVPTIVVMHQHEFDVISGDIPLQTALEMLIEKGTPKVALAAKEFLARVKV